MSVRIEIDYAPTYELVSSLSIFIEKKFIKSLDLGNEWLLDVKKKLSADLANQLSRGKDIPCLDQLDLLVWLSPEKNTIEGFIEWLRSLTPGEMYEMLSPYVSQNLSNDLGTRRDRYVFLLTRWYEEYFQFVDQDIFSKMENDTKLKKALINKMDPIELVEMASGGLRIERLKQEELVVMIPSIHFAPLNSYCEHKSLFIIHYPVDLPNQNQNEPPKSLTRLTRALADDNRLRILKYIAREPRTFTDIVKFSKLSKSTVHHHLMTLRASGLVSVYIDDYSQAAGLYSFRPSSLNELNLQLGTFIEKTS